VDEHRSARQCKGIDAGVSDHLEAIGILLSWSHVGQAFANPGNIGGQPLVVDDLDLLLDFLGSFLSQLNVLDWREKIPARLDGLRRLTEPGEQNQSSDRGENGFCNRVAGSLGGA